MIGKPDVAKYVSELLLSLNGELNESIAKVSRECPPHEAALYKRRVGKIIDAIFEVLLEPIYQSHPALKPPDLN